MAEPLGQPLLQLALSAFIEQASEFVDSVPPAVRLEGGRTWFQRGQRFGQRAGNTPIEFHDGGALLEGLAQLLRFVRTRRAGSAVTADRRRGLDGLG